MQRTSYTGLVVLIVILLCQTAVPVLGQPGMNLNIKKPKEYQNRILRSEKSDQKKFTVPRRFIQNTITHYNYFFNANNKLNEVVKRAKASFVDDYSQLLPFYNYSLDVTAADTVQLDSISYKAQTGIVLHDLRNDWIDNMYVLWGASYYYKKQFDSAQLMFQFINYAFAKKEKDGYYRTIGSGRDGNNAFTISTPEKNSLTRRIFSEPPSRNDAYVWQIRSYLAQDKFAEAASLIQILKNDPEFPSRLYNDLEEVQAWSFYKQNQWDSCAVHLIQALSNASSKLEKARWEFLIAQLYELSHNYTESQNYYSKAISHTTDPVMDVYARLSSIRVNKDGGDDYIQKNIETLTKMAKRDKYLDYRDLIYYMAAQMELERNNIDGALTLLSKSTKYISNNPAQRNKAFLQLAELSFAKRQYRQASNYYDSLDLTDPSIKDPDAITARKDILTRAADNIDIIERQDSLQRIAALPENERRELSRKMARQIRRQQGLKDEGSSTGSAKPSAQPPASLFDNSKKSGWVFDNAGSRQKGLADFKAKWGTRPNTDNWRRSAAQAAVIRTQAAASTSQTQYGMTNIPEKIDAGQQEITSDVLYDRLPLTPEKLKESNDSILYAMHALGLLYVQELEDCPAGIETFEAVRVRFPEHPKMDEVLFNLYHCYNKGGNVAKAEAIKKLLSEKFVQSNFTTIINTGKNPKAGGPNAEATKTYEEIYDLFIEGNFSEAIARKKVADSLYSKNFWTPQLLYIESVYYIKQRQDSSAKIVLNNVIARFPGTPLATKATTMLNVLGRRAQIEEELRNLVINLPPEDTTTRYRPTALPNTVARPLTQDSTKMPANNIAAIDSTKTDDPYVRQQRDSVAKASLGSASQQLPKNNTAGPRIGNNPLRPSDTTRARPGPQVAPDVYYYDPYVPHYVVIILNKVDPIFVSEARNAFDRHNRDLYFNKKMEAELTDIDADNRLVLISPFNDADEAAAYVDQTKPRTATEIIPWLRGGKFSYTIISARNLELLKNSKDISKYTQFIDQHFPGRF
jgi:outer membrane protein assembly factor BamD (BamD/ComL family)